MTYKELLYRNSLEAIRRIYEHSKYDEETDLYRINDIINSLNENQFASKEWLVQKLTPFIPEELENVCILGGWYGLLACMISQEVPDETRIHSVDIDPTTRMVGQALLKDIAYVEFKIESLEDWYYGRPKYYDLIINTSCEHMEPEEVRLMANYKKEEAICCFQGNNYHEIQSHINTHNSLDEFADSLGLKEILLKESMPAANGEYDRYMVIGK